MKEVSVVMPVYNRQKHVGKAIESILNQTYKDFEFIIVDDGSNDKSPSIIKEYSKLDKRIKYVRQQNSGPAHARNTGVRKSQGKYIAFMDDDDLSTPTRLEKQVSYLKSHPTLHACVPFIENVYRDGEFFSYSVYHADRLSNKKYFIKNCFPVPFVLNATTMIIKAAFNKCNEQRTSNNIIEDLDFTLRFQEKFAAGVVAEVLYKYTLPYDNFGSNNNTRFPVHIFKAYIATYISAWCRRNGEGDPIKNNRSIDDIMKLITKLSVDIRKELYNSGVPRLCSNIRKARNISTEEIISVIKILKGMTPKNTKYSQIAKIKKTHIKNLILDGKWHQIPYIVKY